MNAWKALSLVLRLALPIPLTSCQERVEVPKESVEPLIENTASFSYAGLSRFTTDEHLRTRYPTSEGVGSGHVKLSEADSHDHITAIQSSVTADGPGIRLSFGREVPGSPQVDYERCDTVV